MTRPSSVPPPVTAVLDASSRWLPARLGEVEELLREAIAGYGEALGADAAATLGAGGKRLRPMLVLLCAGPERGAEAVRAAAAIELVHMATLVHDDVLDDAPLRRGLPTSPPPRAASAPPPPVTSSSHAPSPSSPAPAKAARSASSPTPRSPSRRESSSSAATPSTSGSAKSATSPAAG